MRRIPTEFWETGELYGFLASPLGQQSVGAPVTHDYTLAVPLSAGETRDTVDFGFYAGGKSTIGDYVWLDSDRNGDHDVVTEQEYEAGIDTVIINVYRDVGTSGVFEPGIDYLWTVTTTGDNLSTAGTTETGWYNAAVVGGQNYWVQVAQENFSPSGPLNGLVATNGNGAVYSADNPQLAILPADPMVLTDVDFGYAPVGTAIVAIQKVLNTYEPVSVGGILSFTITVSNTSTTAVDVLPLVDTYDNDFLAFVGASPAAEDSVNDGTITWSDLTTPAPYGFGGDLGVNQAFQVIVEFVALRDTSALANGATVNTATVVGARDVNGAPVDNVTDYDTVSILTPTAVYFTGFPAVRCGSAVCLDWVTLDETKIAAFNVIRIAHDGTETAVTTVPIAAEFAGQAYGMHYSLVEGGLAAQESATYALDVIGLDGHVTRVTMGRVDPGWMLYLPLVMQVESGVGEAKP